ncbi:YceI family protein [Ferruginibacter lapsinanis]|uniref:YceI family protein n=1 Tax=Ferruginibacter lapsinanis TaxID=563172 RepID=UPI001E5C271C|nr:YceI family protein [Ferruginibacter lapsinanis]UEG51050.1 YceI family protein [Ferruginibacter lapsinanis]
MKKIILSVATLAFLAACNNTPNADKAEAGDKQAAANAEGTAFTIDSNTTVSWTGTKAVGAHKGTFTLKEGSLSVKDDVIVAGSFLIDITSLVDKDFGTDTVSKAKLEGHLKSPDFFDIAKYPTAKFEITGVEPFKVDSASSKNVVLKDANYTIKGNFTLKDSTKNISFPAKITIVDNKLNAVADFNIDRTQWGLNYKGPNNPQDWFIRKEVNLKLNITATKK